MKKLNVFKKFIPVIIAVFISIFISCTISELAMKGDLKTIRERVEKDGENLNQIDAWGWTPIMWTAYYNYYELAKYMIDKKADVNAKTTKEYSNIAKNSTPLIIASIYGNTSIVKLLLRNRADKNAMDENGMDAYDHAEKNNYSEIMAIIKNGVQDKQK
jgi:hypothetical protein